MRIPRKKKKKYKKLWKRRLKYKFYIHKASIEKSDGVWGCIIYPTNETY